MFLARRFLRQRVTRCLSGAQPPFARQENRRCYVCGKEGHMARQCPDRSEDTIMQPRRRIYVYGLDQSTRWQELKDHFKYNGYEVIYASVSVDRETGESKRCGIVQFIDEEEATRAMKDMHGSWLGGVHINCREDRHRPPPPRPPVTAGM